MSEWISVNDRMPEESQFVLVYANDIVTGFMEVVNAYVCPEYGNCDFEDIYTHEDYMPIVTHWMPLPEPPE